MGIRDSVSLLLNPLNHRSKDLSFGISFPFLPFLWYKTCTPETKNNCETAQCLLHASLLSLPFGPLPQDQTPSLAAGDAITRQMKRELFRSECVRDVVITIR